MNMDVFEGTWRDGEKWEGKVTYSDGDVFEGVWVDESTRHGKHVKPNGTFCDGIFNSRSGWRHGKGIKVMPDGTKCAF